MSVSVAAGVSKRSMYQLFESKDELIAAALERRTAGYVADFAPPDGPSCHRGTAFCTSSRRP